MAVISAHALTRRFGTLTAVDGISFDVQHGELFGLVGPDGAGKTTTLRMLAGVLPPTSGDALVRNISVGRDAEAVKEHIAYMSQRFGLYADLSVRENIDFYADLYQVPWRERAERLERLYHFSNLGPFANRLAGQLSGGMQQKLGLCCALIHQPQILLLDEPTFGVDPISRRELWLILQEMIAQGVTVFMATSYMDEAERCDRVALLDRGRIVALDVPHALRRGLGGVMLAVQMDNLRAAAALLATVPQVGRANLFGNVLHVVLPAGADDWPVARAALEREGLNVIDAHEIEPSLEDVFIDRVAAPSAS